MLRGGARLAVYDDVIDRSAVHGWVVELGYERRSSSWCLTVRNPRRLGGQRVAQAYGVEAPPVVFERMGERLVEKLQL